MNFLINLRKYNWQAITCKQDSCDPFSENQISYLVTQMPIEFLLEVFIKNY